MGRLKGSAMVTALWAALSPAMADDLPPPILNSYNDFGATGLMQVPSARMAPDGDLMLGMSHAWPYTRYFLTSQFLPWLQGTFRYTDISNLSYGEASTTGQSYKDKGVDVKVRLLPEGEYNPEVALVMRDIGGTGLFASEYLMASRRYYDFDFSLGLAWGNAGTRGDFSNPLGLLGDRFKRPRRVAGTGSFTGDYFGGKDIAVVGGIEYRTAIDGLRLKLELDGNSYRFEPGNKLPTDSRLNVGMEYQPLDWVSVSGGIERGNTAMFRLVLRTNTNTDKGAPKVDEKPPMPVRPREAEHATVPVATLAPVAAGGAPKDGLNLAEGLSERDTAAPDSGRRIAQLLERMGVRASAVDVRRADVTIRLSAPPEGDALPRAMALMEATEPGYLITVFGADGRKVAGTKPKPSGQAEEGGRLFDALAQYGFTGQRYFVAERQATLVFSQSSYRNSAKPFGRAARIVANFAPPEVEAIHMVLMEDNLPLEEVTLLRQDVEKAANGVGSADEVWMRAVVQDAAQPVAAEGEYSRDQGIGTSVGVLPRLRQSLGGPDAFFLYQVFLEPSISLNLFPGFSLNASGGVNVANNFDRFNYTAPSGLPRVRTNIKEYMKGKDVWLETLHADYLFPIVPQWYGRVSAGMFEQMYGGISGEVLYRPTGKRWAVGADINHVWQRSPDETFKFTRYDITTGNLSYYQLTPFNNLFYQVSVGRYLAGDVGVTGLIGRQFDSGVEMGVWMTKTNVSAAQFGEGSFDKGFYVSVPLDLFYTTPSRQRANFPFRPLIRDGGQKVVTPYMLHGVTGGYGDSATRGGWRDLMN